MSIESKIQLTSTELGNLWMLYLSQCAALVKCECMKNKTVDKETQNIIATYITEGQIIKDMIGNVFNNEKVAIPIAFGEADIVPEAPPLFDDIFKIMILRQMMKLSFAHSSMFSTMSYMKEVHDILKLSYDIADKYYVSTTNYLLSKGVLAKPPYVTMPKQVEIIEDKSYMSGINLFSDKRPLNTIEVGFINETIENNIFGIQLMTGFAQSAKDNEVKEYFIKGKELAKKIVSTLGEVLSQSDVQSPGAWAGRVTDSTKATTSDKLMMYTTSLMSSAAIGYNLIGTPFSLRSDLQAHLSLIAKDTLGFAKDGSKLMIKNKWMEEPPQMEDRNLLTK